MVKYGKLNIKFMSVITHEQSKRNKTQGMVDFGMLFVVRRLNFLKKPGEMYAVFLLGNPTVDFLKHNPLFNLILKQMVKITRPLVSTNLNF